MLASENWRAGKRVPHFDDRPQVGLSTALATCQVCWGSQSARRGRRRWSQWRRRSRGALDGDDERAGPDRRPLPTHCDLSRSLAVQRPPRWGDHPCLGAMDNHFGFRQSVTTDVRDTRQVPDWHRGDASTPRLVWRQGIERVAGRRAFRATRQGCLPSRHRRRRCEHGCSL